MANSLLKNKREFLYILIFLLIYFLLHTLIWLFSSSFDLKIFVSIFQNWDAGIYNAISSGLAYKETINSNLDTNFAFYPLWPVCVWLLGKALGVSFEAPYVLIGAAFSSLIFIFFIALVYKIKSLPHEMKPQTWFGWFLFIFSPASYIFHTNHTEAFFLIISWLAFFYAIQGKIKISAVLAGLCALIKNQGVITSLIVAFVIAVSKGKNFKERTIYFICSGMVSGFIFSFWLLFQFFRAGTPFAFIHVQQNWQHANGIIDYFYTWVYNFRYVIQLINGTRSFRAILFYIGIAIAIYLIFYKKNKIMHKNEKKINLSLFFGLYIFLCSALLPLQGFLENTFRFHLILFPLWFVLGDIIYNYIKSIKSAYLSNTLMILVISAILSLNCWMAYLYSKGLWAY